MTYQELRKMAEQPLTSDDELQDAVDAALANGEITVDECFSIEALIEMAHESCGGGVMRAEFLEGCKSAREARSLAPWAARVFKVEGGYRAWESLEDFKLWMRAR